MGLLVGSGPLKPVLKRGKTVIAPDSGKTVIAPDSRLVVSVTSWCEAKLLSENCLQGRDWNNSRHEF